jgi:hypothetical protein
MTDKKGKNKSKKQQQILRFAQDDKLSAGQAGGEA